jgi:ribosomal protein S18 acetylase RimI-like enzyme
MQAGDDPALRVRAATPRDMAEMIPLVNAAFAIETFLEGTRTDEIRMAEMMGQGQFLVARNEAGRVVASVYFEKRGDRAYLGMLAVDPAYQGKGVGRTMMEAAEHQSRMQGCLYIDITVLSLRPELPPIYRKLGYTGTGTEEFHPSQPLKSGVVCHSIVMSKALTSPEPAA